MSLSRSCSRYCSMILNIKIVLKYQSKKAHDKEAEENIVVDNETGEVKKDEAKTVAEPKKTVVQEADSDEETVEEIELGGDNENIDNEEITIIDVDEIEGIEAFN